MKWLRISEEAQSSKLLPKPVTINLSTAKMDGLNSLQDEFDNLGAAPNPEYSDLTGEAPVTNPKV